MTTWVAREEGRKEGPNIPEISEEVYAAALQVLRDGNSNFGIDVRRFRAGDTHYSPGFGPTTTWSSGGRTYTDDELAEVRQGEHQLFLREQEALKAYCIAFVVEKLTNGVWPHQPKAYYTDAMHEAMQAVIEPHRKASREPE